ncbi:MAG: serine hydrolase [Ignavibacteriales bacterium]|nr:serine hydrolase [Ignavibacteriales bacterium]MCF8306141.1 serine hydrolase [Ignavibacteriales bacterium]MCF8315805.1 serine hydrolase [Ignavibacteriales bacterium]MCF8437265.1 serine hydrolase [Ignavibacteriales bacterium]
MLIIPRKISLVALFFLFNGFFYPIGLSQGKDSLVVEVENGLLPNVLVEGEPSLNLWDRMTYYKVPGVSITVIKDFKIDWTRTYGVMDYDLQNPVSDETLFGVGSLSKAVASLAVLRLVEEGKVDLRADINDQLISWKIPENEFTRQHRVTPLLLMNHSGGAMFSPGIGYLGENFPTNLQVLNGEKPAQYKPVVFDRIPGTEFQYSNAGYSILQQLIEDVAGKSYPEYVQEAIFTPLDMRQATLFQPLSENLEKIAAAGHMQNGLPFIGKRFYIQPAAAGGLWTNSSDYAKFIIELQKAYAGLSDKIISPPLAKEMLSPHASKQYGLGVFMREMYGEINYFGHLGDSKGFFAGFASHLTDGYGAVVLTNSQNGAQLIREITNGIAKVYNWKKYLPEAYKLVPVEKKLLDQLSGRYLMGSDDYFEITKEQDKFYIDKFDNAQLFYVGDGKFVTKFRPGYLEFKFGSDQKIISAVYYFADELGRFLNESSNCRKMEEDEKVPVEFLREGKIDKALLLYRKIKSENSSDDSINENRLNELGYIFLNQDLLNEAVSIFNLNVEFYPESANCYDSLAEAYLKAGNKNMAKINYKRSLELNPQNQNAVLMLKKIESGQ